MSTRRRFIKLGAASVGSLALRNFGAIPALAQTSSDYKALVCVFLFGGNDANNMIIPIDLPQATYAQYQTLRTKLALPTTSLSSPVTDVNNRNYYFHGGLSDMAALFSSGSLAVAANVGPLVAPVTRSQVNNPAMVPAHLFSHSDQQQEWQTSDPTQTKPFGWGGLLADKARSKNVGAFPTFLSVAGNTIIGAGKTSQQVALSPGGSLNMTGFDYNLAQARSAAMNRLITTESGLSLLNAANGILSESIADARLLTQALSGVTISTVFPNTSLGNQLKQVAQIIKARDALQMSRQIFFCSLGGFDTHVGELATHQQLYPILNNALLAFHKSMSEELLLDKNVTLFTESDFSRTFQATTGDGSDHAWGSHHLIMGGSVKGQTVYNKFPTFTLGSNDDFDTRGRWIPTAAVDQYGASLVQWFDSDSGVVDYVFPNLAKNFVGIANPFASLFKTA